MDSIILIDRLVAQLVNAPQLNPEFVHERRKVICISTFSSQRILLIP